MSRHQPQPRVDATPVVTSHNAQSARSDVSDHPVFVNGSRQDAEARKHWGIAKSKEERVLNLFQGSRMGENACF